MEVMTTSHPEQETGERDERRDWEVSSLRFQETTSLRFPSLKETRLTLSNLPSRLGDGNGDRLAILSLSTELEEVVDSALGPVPDDQRRPALGMKGSGHVLFGQRWNDQESAYIHTTLKHVCHYRLCIDPFISCSLGRRAGED